jgi:hypothetical protein
VGRLAQRFCIMNPWRKNLYKRAVATYGKWKVSSLLCMDDNNSASCREHNITNQARLEINLVYYS